MRKFGVFFKIITCSLFVTILQFPILAIPSISAECAVLINADTCEIIFEHNADVKKGMASTTKIMTAIIAIESGKLEEKFIVPDEAIGVEGSSLYLQKGESMTLKELVIGLMLRSANDAAEAIAIILSGSIEAFSDVMNLKAQELGLHGTHFTNPHGLACDNHYTTAKELALLAAYAVKNEAFREICSMSSAKIPGVEYPRIVTNHNKMLKLYPGSYGIKTGFTKATGRCLVSAAERNGINLIAVTLNAPDDWNDHKNLLDYGFSNYELVNLAESGQIIYSLPIINGTKSTVSVYIPKDINVSLNKNRKSIVEKVEIISPRFAPVYQGDIVGNIKYYIDNREIASSPLCACEFVGISQKNKTFLSKLFN